MDNSSSDSSASPSKNSTLWILTILLAAPVLAAMLVYQFDSFEPAHVPLNKLTGPPLTAALRNERMLKGSEFLGLGVLQGPEDLVYDSESKVIYTGCKDGWIKRVRVNESAADSQIEDWIYTGGRPLGLALWRNEMVIADADKGLLKVIGNTTVLLTDEAEGKKFKLTDGVDIAENGMIYFTDASYKYRLSEYIWDILEGKPHGRLLSFDPVTKETRVLVSDLYFPNGVAVSPDQTHVVFCETPMRRCRKYYINGEKSGLVEKFADYLPGFPDNIRYDGEGNYLIAIPLNFTKVWDVAFRYPFMRKIAGLVVRYFGMPHAAENSGVFIVDLEGNPTAHYHDPTASFVCSATKIGDHLYFGSEYHPYILRLDVRKHPARAIVGETSN